MKDQDNVSYMGNQKHRHEVAAHLREIADDLEGGKIQAVAIAAGDDDHLTSDYVILPSARKETVLALIGMLTTLGLLLANDSLQVADEVEEHV